MAREKNWALVELDMPNGWRVVAGDIGDAKVNDLFVKVAVYHGPYGRPVRTEQYTMEVVRGIHECDGETACAIGKASVPVSIMWMQRQASAPVHPIVGMMAGGENTTLPKPDFKPVEPEPAIGEKP